MDQENIWQNPKTAPKDGQVISADFQTEKTTVEVLWHSHLNRWIEVNIEGHSWHHHNDLIRWKKAPRRKESA